MSITFVLLIVANVKERKEKRWVAGYVLFALAYVAVTIFTYHGISSILVFITSSVTLICIWWLEPQKMRVVGGCNCFVYLAYQISIQNWAGLLEILVIISNFVSFIMRRREEDKG